MKKEIISKDADGNTALHNSLYDLDYKRAEELIRNGANTDIVNHDRWSPLDICYGLLMEDDISDREREKINKIIKIIERKE